MHVVFANNLFCLSGPANNFFLIFLTPTLPSPPPPNPLQENNGPSLKGSERAVLPPLRSKQKRVSRSNLHF